LAYKREESKERGIYSQKVTIKIQKLAKGSNTKDSKNDKNKGNELRKEKEGSKVSQ